MTARLVRFGMLVAALLAVPAAIWAQEPPKKPEPPPDGSKQVTWGELQKELAPIQKELKEIAPIKGQLTTLSAEMTRVSTGLDSINAKLDQLLPVPRSGYERPVTREEFDLLLERMRNNERRIDRITRAVSDADGRVAHVLDIKSQMQNSTFRSDLASAVHEVIRQRGTLRVRNEMSTAEYLRVNGQDYRIPALSSIEVDVPVGTVTTELAGYEPPKNWSVGPPNYSQQVDIRPQVPRRIIVDPLPVVPEPFVILGPPRYIWPSPLWP